jgi:hypothetical protein
LGKAAKLKKINRVAREMPIVKRNTIETHFVKGDELIASYGTNKMPNGEIIDPEKVYRQQMPVIAEVNHKRKMKRMFNQYGYDGIVMYMQAVEDHLAKQ